MKLSLQDVDLFFVLHRSLMFYVNKRLKVIDRKVATIREYAGLPGETRIKVHQALLTHIELIDDFAKENPYRFDEPNLEIIRSWKHFVTGTFCAFRQLQAHMVFLSSTEPIVAYGVVALYEPFEAMVGPFMPSMIETTLLPFKGRIVYDSIIRGYDISFGDGIKRKLAESYQEANERSGIVTSLPAPAWQPHRARSKAIKGPPSNAAGTTRTRSAAQDSTRSAHEQIVDLTNTFCQDHLDGEYAAFCRKLAGILARKRPSPLLQGKPESWASGIVRVIGSVNFLSDPSQPLHMKMTDIDKRFGVSEATGSAKAKAIRDLLQIDMLDPRWTLPSLMEQNPLAWMIELNGMVADARRLPRKIQEEAFRKGLIPFIPGDRRDKAE